MTDSRNRPRYWKLVVHTPVPVDLLTWARSFETRDRCVARTHVGGYEISTVFLGLDHNFSQNGPALLFETMVFPLRSGGEREWLLDGYTARYATWDEAASGHEAVCARLRAVEGGGP